ncbi:unnamed protein product [Protopolystoma xenopodis]|uniref:Uncharacterized protein n=1 Tax=Protopolystoma xenopodis TaxID=117903 RepID=A0A3S5CGU4_9PLAT|nr:unnamed protein product [Protopolystoma xenopodis]
MRFGDARRELQSLDVSQAGYRSGRSSAQVEETCPAIPCDRGILACFGPLTRSRRGRHVLTEWGSSVLGAEDTGVLEPGAHLAGRGFPERQTLLHGEWKRWIRPGCRTSRASRRKGDLPSAGPGPTGWCMNI